MMAEPVLVAQDRSMSVPPGKVIRTGYMPVESIRMACRDRMAIGDVEKAYRKRLQLGEQQPWPCPRGYLSSGQFVLEDGRHEFVASLMLGHTHLLVTWLKDSDV